MPKLLILSMLLANAGLWIILLSIFLGDLHVTTVGCLMCVLSLLLTNKAVRDV